MTTKKKKAEPVRAVAFVYENLRTGRETQVSPDSVDELRLRRMTDRFRMAASIMEDGSRIDEEPVVEEEPVQEDE